MILRGGERPLAEAGKRARHRCDSDVTKNFPAFYSLPAQLSPSPVLKPLSDSGYIGCVFSTACKAIPSGRQSLFRAEQCQVEITGVVSKLLTDL